MDVSVESFPKLQSQYDAFMATSSTEEDHIQVGKNLLVMIRSAGRYTTDSVAREVYAQMARDIGERLFALTGDYLSVRLDPLQISRPNPFVYGRPVKPSEFVGRESELRTVFNRLLNCESTAIVGEPHIGKTSLLLKLADEKTRLAYLGDSAESLSFVFLDLHFASSDYSPTVFWEQALDPLRKLPGDIAEACQLGQIVNAHGGRRSLERLLKRLGDGGRRLVLLLDEFDCLLAHPNFQNASFFASLRSFATRSGGLALVTASRLSIAEMNERGRDFLDFGSPFFNIMIDLRLSPFDERIVGKLLDQAGEAFSQDDRHFIRRVAGRCPYLLQAMAGALIETSGEERQVRAAEDFYGRVSSHFDDLWRSLNERTRATVMVLGLLELGARMFGMSFSYGEIEKVDAFGVELQSLARRGLAERVKEDWQFGWEHLPSWRGERWTVGSQAFAWWVFEVAVAGARSVPAYDEWLAGEGYRSLLTPQQWNRLLDVIRGTPEWAVYDIRTLASGLREELPERRK